MEELVTHEVAHIVHLTRPRTRSRGILARISPIPLGPLTLKSPRWLTEGYATVLEGALSGSGRPASSYRAMVLRRFAIEGKLPGYGALNATSGWLGGSMAYLVGSTFLEWLEAKEGKGSLPRLWKRMASRRGGDFPTAFRAVFGRNPWDLYDRFRAEITAAGIEEERRLVAAGLSGGETWQRLDGGTLGLHAVAGRFAPAREARPEARGDVPRGVDVGGERRRAEGGSAAPRARSRPPARPERGRRPARDSPAAPAEVAASERQRLLGVESPLDAGRAAGSLCAPRARRGRSPAFRPLALDSGGRYRPAADPLRGRDRGRPRARRRMGSRRSQPLRNVGAGDSRSCSRSDETDSRDGWRSGPLARVEPSPPLAGRSDDRVARSLRRPVAARHAPLGRGGNPRGLSSGHSRGRAGVEPGRKSPLRRGGPGGDLERRVGGRAGGRRERSS